MKDKVLITTSTVDQENTDHCQSQKQYCELELPSLVAEYLSINLTLDLQMLS